MRMQQHTQPDAKGNPIERLRKGQGEGAYLGTMRMRLSWGVQRPLEQLWRHSSSHACHSCMAGLLTQQPMWVEVTKDSSGYACRRIVPAETFPEHRNGIRERQVGLGDNDLISQRHLFTGHRVPVEVQWPVHGIYGGDHAVDAKVVLEHGIRYHRKHQRCRVCQTCRFDHDAPERCDNTALIAIQ